MRVMVWFEVEITDQERLIEVTGPAVEAAGNTLVYPTDEVRVGNVITQRVLLALPDFSDVGFEITQIAVAN